MPTGDTLDALLKVDLPEVEAILERESRPVTRVSLLLAPTGKLVGARIEQILRGVREGAGNGSAGARAPARAPGPPGATGGRAAAVGGRGAAAAATDGGGGGGAPPPLIIVVPAATAGGHINMWNAAEFIVRGRCDACVRLVALRRDACV
jgi:hypothetical protein